MDRLIVEWLNQFARDSFAFDRVIDAFTTLNLLKGGMPMAVWWALWFRGDQAGRRPDDRTRLLASLLGGGVALATARALALLLPFRLRPMHDSSLGWVLPFGADPGRLSGFSAMPSDHAVLYFSLAAGMWCVNRIAGYALAAYLLFAVGFARVYAGLHFPSDVLVGAVVGCAIGALAQSEPIRGSLGRLIAVEARRPALFYAGLFLVTLEIAVMLVDVRAWGKLSLDILRNWLGS